MSTELSFFQKAFLDRLPDLNGSFEKSVTDSGTFQEVSVYCDRDGDREGYIHRSPLPKTFDIRSDAEKNSNHPRYKVEFVARHVKFGDGIPTVAPLRANETVLRPTEAVICPRPKHFLDENKENWPPTAKINYISPDTNDENKFIISTHSHAALAESEIMQQDILSMAQWDELGALGGVSTSQKWKVRQMWSANKDKPLWIWMQRSPSLGKASYMSRCPTKIKILTSTVQGLSYLTNFMKTTQAHSGQDGHQAFQAHILMVT